MIEILPESHENILFAKATGQLTIDDYEQVFIPKLNELIKEYGKIRVVLYLDENFSGWEIGAMWDDAKFGIQHLNDFEKVALVGGEKWTQWMTNIGSYFIKGEVKTFDHPALPEALAWIGD